MMATKAEKAAYARQWYRTEHGRAVVKLYKASARYLAVRKRHRDTHQKEIREYAWKVQGLTGATWEKYLACLEQQGGGCAICGRPPGKNALHWDHDHSTKRLRGLLCVTCNRMLGFLENPGWAIQATLYIKIWAGA